MFLIVTVVKELESGTAYCCLGSWPEKTDNKSINEEFKSILAAGQQNITE